MPQFLRYKPLPNFTKYSRKSEKQNLEVVIVSVSTEMRNDEQGTISKETLSCQRSHTFPILV